MTLLFTFHLREKWANRGRATKAHQAAHPSPLQLWDRFGTPRVHLPSLPPSPYISLWDSARSPHPTVKSRFLSKESWGQVYTFPLVSRRCSLTPPLPLPPPLSLSLPTPGPSSRESLLP